MFYDFEETFEIKLFIKLLKRTKSKVHGVKINLISLCVFETVKICCIKSSFEMFAESVDRKSLQNDNLKLINIVSILSSQQNCRVSGKCNHSNRREET